MVRRASSLNNYTNTAITREIDSKYDNVKLVADNIADVDSLAAAILDGSFTSALSIVDMVVVQGPEGSLPTWDGTTLTIPKGDTGSTGAAGADAPTIVSILKTNTVGLVDTYTILLSDASNYTFDVTNGYTPVKGVDYTDGADGKSAYELWLDDGNVGTLGEFLLSIQGATGPQGIQGIQGIQGLAGQDLTIDQIVYNGDGTFTWQFSDGSGYTTPDMTGPQGIKGDTGDKGDTGISVHHMKGTSTTNPLGDFHVAGETDTYTFYGDAGETIVLGYFSVTNGVDGVHNFTTFYQDKVLRIGDSTLVLTTAAQTILEAINELDAAKFESAGGIITGNVEIQGDFTVGGTTTTVNSQTVTTADNLIVINNGEVGSGVTNGTAGIEVDRGLLTNYQFLFDEVSDTFKIGELGNLQAVATREDTPLNTGIAYWDTATSKFNTTRDIDVDSIAVTGLVDGRDISVDGAKLDTIETNAKDDQLASEVPVTPVGNLASTNVQLALEELQGDINYINTGTTEW